MKQNRRIRLEQTRFTLGHGSNQGKEVVSWEITIASTGGRRSCANVRFLAESGEPARREAWRQLRDGFRGWVRSSWRAHRESFKRSTRGLAFRRARP